MADETTRNVDEWLVAFAQALGVPAPDDETVNAVLALAGVAAHSSERKAAPVACWIAASAGRSPAEALEVARGLPGASQE